VRVLLATGTLTLAIAGCGGKPPASSTPAAPPATAEAPPPEAAPAPLAATDTTWTPEALEELLAPIALYPDVVLGQVLVASTNPQEVLDAGNWLLQNQKLDGKALDEAAKTIGFTPPVRGLLQSPEVMDMLCMELDWTTELGQAFVNDQAGALDAVQRLRAQAKDVGNLASSDKLTVETEQQDGKDVITVAPPTPEVVYVPQYDPVAVYAPPAPVPAPATTTTVVTEEKKGFSTGAMVTTGLLAFGGGLLVSEIFEDDDDDWDNYSPRYYGSPMPYYPPYPYRPRYGNGYYPNSDYRRPANYNKGFNNNTIIVNNGNDDYWNRYDRKSGNDRNSRKVESPISAAKPNRPELDALNARAKDQPKRAAPAQPDAWKGQSGYAGAKPGAKDGAKDKVTDARTGDSSPRVAAPPKVQGSYAGGKAAGPSAAAKAASPRPAAKDAASGVQRPAAKPAARPDTGTARTAAADRGRPAAAASQASKPSAPARAPDRSKSSAVSGATRGGAGDKAASQRGRESMPKGVPAKAKSPGNKSPGKKAGR
jgi:hypothetical protein